VYYNIEKLNLFLSKKILNCITPKIIKSYQYIIVFGYVHCFAVLSTIV